jgi:hypothetical protein
MMSDPDKLRCPMSLNAPPWREQCDAARSIKEEFGCEKALGYLLGEKFLSYLRATDRDPTLRDDLPRFVAEVREIFETWELREYLSGVRRLGAAAHVLNQERYDEMSTAGALGDDVVHAAEDVLLLERAKRMLLSL